MNIDYLEIKKILPQSYPFIMVDGIKEFLPKEKLVSFKNITINEVYLTGHFPNRPIMPGVLIIESMAQSAIIFFAKSYEEKIRKDLLYYLGKVEAKFLRPVFCGDRLEIEIKPLKIISNAGIVSACAFVKDTLVAKAELAFSAK